MADVLQDVVGTVDEDTQLSPGCHASRRRCGGLPPARSAVIVGSVLRPCDHRR